MGFPNRDGMAMLGGGVEGGGAGWGVVREESVTTCKDVLCMGPTADVLVCTCDLLWCLCLALRGFLFSPGI